MGTNRKFATKFATRQEAQSRIFFYIEGFYNRIRRHSAIDIAKTGQKSADLLKGQLVSL